MNSNNFAAVAAIAMCFTSCITVGPKRLLEPAHTMLMVSCMEQGAMASACSCAEDLAVQETGMVLPSDNIDAEPLFKAFEKYSEKCIITSQAEVDAAMKQLAEKPAVTEE